MRDSEKMESITESREREAASEMRSILHVIANWMAMPLFLIFWVADAIYVPTLKWQFLMIRLLILPLCLIVTQLSKKISDPRKLRHLAVAYSVSIAFGINLMIALIGDPTTSYYAGLFLVLIGGASFIPFSKREFVAVVSGIYGPYFIIVLLQATAAPQFKAILINGFFIFSSIGICFLVRFFNEGIRMKDLESRRMLKEEVKNREEIIEKKTEEAVNMAGLSRQFSPQVVESIKSGKLKLESSGSRSEICAVFIDIVNSTDRVVRIDKEKVEKVLTRFLDDVIKILLKYDLTIDKFLGDGILAFCNAPLPRVDFVQRVLKATLEIREKLKQDQGFYEKHWLRPLEIRAGIAKGYSNVGFYGSKKYYQSYTAIGPVMNLAARLCASADPNQILIDWDVQTLVESDFNTKFLNKRSFKGFESDVIHVYEVMEERNQSQIAVGMTECPTCNSILSLEVDTKGHFVFMCKSCCEILDQKPEAA
jgi:class 3 adenylate cyclase